MLICKTAKFAPVWTSIIKIGAIFVHQTLTEHALLHFFTIFKTSIINLPIEYLQIFRENIDLSMNNT